MTREVLLSGKAQRAFQGLPESAQKRIREVLVRFASSGRGDVKRLHGTKEREDLFRLRVGDYRVVFAI